MYIYTITIVKSNDDGTILGFIFGRKSNKLNENLLTNQINYVGLELM